MKRKIDDMKTECTCVNCALLECSVRLDCEDDELPIETEESKAESSDSEVTVSVGVTELAEQVVAEKRFW